MSKKIDGNTDSWIGRGWLTINTDGSASAAPAQERFFTATRVPVSSSMASWDWLVSLQPAVVAKETIDMLQSSESKLL